MSAALPFGLNAVGKRRVGPWVTFAQALGHLASGLNLVGRRRPHHRALQLGLHPLLQNFLWDSFDSERTDFLQKS